MHASKKLERVEHEDEGGAMILHFTDGTTHECDVLVGADGIHSTVRKIILGEQDPAVHPRNAGWWAIMTLKPYVEARASLGEGPVDAANAREHMWVGDRTYLMHNVLNDGQLVQVIISVRDEDAEGSDRWHRLVDAEEITNLYQDWPPYLKKAVKEVTSTLPAMIDANNRFDD
jgi:salicylate hydroxylase